MAINSVSEAPVGIGTALDIPFHPVPSPGGKLMLRIVLVYVLVVFASFAHYGECDRIVMGTGAAVVASLNAAAVSLNVRPNTGTADSAHQRFNPEVTQGFQVHLGVEIIGNRYIGIWNEYPVALVKFRNCIA